MGMKASDIHTNVSFKTMVDEARMEKPSVAWAATIQRVAGLAYIEAQKYIHKNGQKHESYVEAAKIIKVALEAVSQQKDKAEKVYEARQKGHRNTKDVREALMVAEQIKVLLESYLGQLNALVNSSGSGNLVQESVNQWINKINTATGDTHMIASDKDWNAIFEGSSVALQFVSLDGYVYRFVKAATALKKMLIAAKTDDRIVENADDLVRLMERSQLAYADLINARKALIAKNKAVNEEKAH